MKRKCEDSLNDTNELFNGRQIQVPSSYLSAEEAKALHLFNVEYSFLKKINVLKSTVGKESILNSATSASEAIQLLKNRSKVIEDSNQRDFNPVIIEKEEGDDLSRAVLENLPGSKSMSTAEARLAETREKMAPVDPATALVLRHKRRIEDVPKPDWHCPWKLMRVISGHNGWVRAIAVDVANEWFVTGSNDRTIKIWDLASGTLKLTLTGHISSVRGLAISERHSYLYSVGEDKMVKAWDLEQNKVVRNYHGHLSGMYTCSLHKSHDILFTGGRDAVVRVWDIRTRQQVGVLEGHSSAVWDIKTQGLDPQVLTGAGDAQIRLWDLAAFKCQTILTHHKKAVRSLALSNFDFSFASASPDNIKKWKLPEGQFVDNYSGHEAIINTLALNDDGVLVSGADNGTIKFWDYKTGYNFQSLLTQVQPGSLEAEAGIFASSFDKSGSRFITCEADKTIKFWKEDENANEKTHPIDWKVKLAGKKRW